MGAGESKPSSPQLWQSSGPAGISQDLVDSMRSSNETDASRAKSIEIQIQARVAEELKKLQKQQDEALNKAHERLSSSAGKDGKSNAGDDTPSSYTVGKEVEALRKKLDEKKKVRELPESVDKARSEVIRCLRENDRRPLDCWQEVEDFKAEVKKLEQTWVNKVVS